MTYDEILSICTRWQDVMKEAELQLDQLSFVIGTSPEAPLQDAVYRLMGTFTESVQSMIGTTDWLNVWWLDHNFGEKPLTVSINDGEWLEIQTVEQLVTALIADSEGEDHEL